jgi:trimeric autotransporter adhesin
MASVVANRAYMTTATTGTGTITLGSAMAGYQSFDAAGILNGNTVSFTIIDGLAWEVSTGVYIATGTMLTRVLEESSTGSLLVLTGSAQVFITPIGADLGNWNTAYTKANAALPKAGGTMTGNLTFGDSDKAIFGTSSVLEIYGDGTTSYIKESGTGDLKVRANRFVIQDVDGTKDFLIVSPTAGAVLSHLVSGTMVDRVTTTFGGVALTGDITVTGTVDGRDIATDGTKLDSIEDLAAIAATKAVTAVDVFVYDTSLDSDGGAWRKRTQHTSWYNETLDTSTRGARREFPAVAVIVMTNVQLTIYDGDDPSLPMWMVFENAGSLSWGSGSTVVYTSVHALNGKIVPVSSTGAMIYDFPLDDTRIANVVTYNLTSNRALVGRNGATSFASGGDGYALVNSVSNDVAMTVLPNAPIDAATGLPVPTIAVATNGGLSVINNDGTVADSSTTLGLATCGFTQSGLMFGRNTAGYLLYYSTHADYQSGDGHGDPIGQDTAGAQEIDILTRLHHLAIPSGDRFVYGGNGSDSGTATNGLWTHTMNPSDFTKGMSTFTTSTYNTGYMVGDIKGAWLSDTDETALVGTAPLEDDFSSYADTAAMKAAGWSSATSSGTADISLVSGAMQLDCDGTANRARGSRPFTTVVGQEYVVEYSSTLGHHFRVGTTENGTQILSLLNQPSGSNTFAYTFVATATTTYVTWEAFNAAGNEPQIDNVSVKLADADRSVNNNGLIVNGTVTRTAVATGADLVAYSGFSASNYLEQPYNSDLDFGTGDFSIMGWVKAADTGGTNTSILMRSGATGLGKIRVRSKLGKFAMWISDDGVSTLDEIIGTSDIDNNNWNFVCSVRQGSFLYAYVNGSLEATASVVNAAGSLSSSDATTRVGISDAGAEPWAGSLALLRISATAPTAEQIAKIYNDEKFLFQENAGAVLHGTSDAVTALAHDSATDLLHVGTSQGRSVFQGLRRVENTTTAVGTAISASNGLVVEE